MPRLSAISFAAIISCGLPGHVTGQIISQTINPAPPECPLRGVASIAIDRKGDVLVVDPPDRLVCRFGSDGRLKNSFGNSAQPLGWPLSIGTMGDTVWIFDSQFRQIRFYSSLGMSLGSVDTPQLMSSCRLLPGGVLLALSQPLSDSNMDVVTETVTELLPDGATRALASLRHRRVALTVRADSVGTTFHQPFADEPLWSSDPAGRTLVIVERGANQRDPSRARIVSIDVRTGDTISVKDVAGPRMPITDIDVAAEVGGMDQKLHKSYPDLRAHMTPQTLGTALFRPRLRPPFVAVLVGSDGAVWLQNAATLGTPVSWTVLKGERRFLARVDHPDAYLLAADAHSFWTLDAGKEGVQTINRYRWQ